VKRPEIWFGSGRKERTNWLKSKGVALEKYPFVQDRELGIWTTPGGDKVGLFKDPDGNVLSIGQHPSRNK
jgi:hypothetical protein